MTPTPPPARPTPPTGPRPAPGAAPVGAGAALAIDPVKLLLKYRWVLLIAAVAGGVIGVVAHFVVLRVHPVYNSSVIFQCLTATESPGQINITRIDQNEIELFMGTQVQQLRSESTIARVVADPRLAQEAPNWIKPFVKGGVLDVVDAAKELEKIIRASAVPNTYLIRLSVATQHPIDSAGIVRLVRENYLDDLFRRSNSDINKKRDALRRSIRDAEQSVDRLNIQRGRLVQDERLDTLDGQRSAASESLRNINGQLLAVQLELESAQVGLSRDEAQLEREVGIQFDNTMRLEVEQSPQVLGLQQQINALESELGALRQIGILPNHRQFRAIQSQIDGTRQQMDSTRERLLREAFEARVDQYRLYLQQLRAQEADLLRQREEVNTELIKLTEIFGQVSDIDRSIETTINMVAQHTMNLSDLDAAASLDEAVRIRVIQSESIPDTPDFPKLAIMMPLGVIVIGGLCAGVVLVIEILDQRIKGPSDLNALGRIPVLGIVPDSAEDPSSPEHPESVFRDVPGSVSAEHYRQIRTRVAKAMARGGHKTLLVVGATPGSGATSVVSNLGSALLAAGHRVLVVDANYRRPRLHMAFDAPESPGLADVLTGSTSIDTAIVSRTGGPDLLAAGTAKNRMVEQLGGDKLSNLLGDLRDRYDFVLIDVAPALVAGDAQSLANRCDASMLVARALHEKRGMVARLRNELSESRAEFLGALVNAVRSSAGGYMRKNIKTSAAYTASDTTVPAT